MSIAVWHDTIMVMASDRPLVVRNLTKRYGRARGVEDVSFELEPGEVFGFLGPNGAGKTTTIRTILDFMRPTSGGVEIFGLDSVRQSVEAKRHIGYLAGDFAVYENLTGKQLVDYMASLDGEIDREYVGQIVSRFGIEMGRPLRQLSKGNRQKLGLLQAFMHRPKLLILDEPTSGLDPLMQEEFYKLLADVKAAGVTVFISSHNLGEVQRVCDRAAFIREGKLIAIEDIAKARKMNISRFTVLFGEAITPSDFENIEGVEDVTKAGAKQLHFVVAGHMDAFVKALAKHKVQSIIPEETQLEDVFMRYYAEGKI